jgi:FG-GAP repeat
VFAKPVSGWVSETEAAKLSASDGAAGDELGFSVAVDDNTLWSPSQVRPHSSGRTYDGDHLETTGTDASSPFAAEEDCAVGGASPAESRKSSADRSQGVRY